MPSLGHQRENDLFFFLTHSFPAFPPVLFGLCRAEVSRGREVRDRTGFGSIVTWFWRSLNRVDVPLLDYFLREHLRVVGGGGRSSEILPLLGCLTPGVTLKWEMAPPAGQLLISARLPFYFLIHSAAELLCGSPGLTLSQEDLVWLPSASPPLAQGRCISILVPSGCRSTTIPIPTISCLFLQAASFL